MKFSCRTCVLLFFWKCTPLKPHSSASPNSRMSTCLCSNYPNSASEARDIKWKWWSHNITILKVPIAIWLIEIHQLAPVVKRAKCMRMTRIYLHEDSSNRLVYVKGLKESLDIFNSLKIGVSPFTPQFNQSLRSD